MINSKFIGSVILLSSLLVSSASALSEQQVDDMVDKLNYQEEIIVNTNIKDPFGYPPEIVKKKKKVLLKKKVALSTSNEKAKKEEKKVVINYQGIIINKAVVNNKKYVIGDVIYGATITYITPIKLYLQQNDFIFTVNKNKSNVQININKETK